MPLAQRTIEPIHLGRHPLTEEETGEDVVQTAVTQHAVLATLVQLASLVRHADDLFCDLSDECQKVFEQTERIIHRVKRIKEGVGRLDSKHVPIPVGDLKWYSSIQDHHVARHGFDCSFFTPESRPHCLKARYSLCEVTPVGALRGADLYRKDGLRSSNLFKLGPIVLRDHKVNTPDLNLPKKQGKAMIFNKRYKRLTPRPKTVHGIDCLDMVQRVGKVEEESDADVTLSMSQPSILVAVDTSGAGFHRMSSFRQSLKGTASLDRKKRRRTVSGVPGHLLRDIEVFERGKKTPRSTPRDYSFDDLDSRREPEKDESIAQYFDELDAKMAERAEKERASREPKLLKFLPCRRSRSLPRCVKITAEKFAGVSSGGGGVMVFEQDELVKGKDRSVVPTASGHKSSSSLSLGSAGASSSSSRTSKRSSLIGSKIRSFVAGTLSRQRPKSLDLDAIDVLGNDNDADAEDDSSSSIVNGKVTLKRKLSPSMPEDISSLSSSRESKVGPGTYYYFTSSTLPRAQARKYDFPWESLPKDWTTSVKLREISKRKREERNSSSGNWSGSSNRHSLDSARSSTLPSSASQHSLGRDSGRGSPFIGENKDGTDQPAKDYGVSSFLPLATRATTTATTTTSSSTDTEQWLASLAKRAAAREDAAAAGSDVTSSLTRLSQLTKQNIEELDHTFSPLQRTLCFEDEEVSSVHSLDQDGFYTSFHTDSGLRRSTGTLLDDDDGRLTPVREARSLLSMGSTNTIDSVIFRPLGATTSLGTTHKDVSRNGGKPRPPPPARCGSRLSSNSSLLDAEEKLRTVGEALSAANVPGSGTMLPAALAESSQSESDQETVSIRLRAKTKITRGSIPSWCLISDEDSTDSSNVCLTAPDAQDSTSAVLPDRTGSEQTVANITPFTKEGELCDAMWNSSTLPRRYLETKVLEEERYDQYNSWPRAQRLQHKSPSGIVQGNKSPSELLPAQTSNCAPQVAILAPHLISPGVQPPLHAASSSSTISSSSSIDCSSDVSNPRLSYKLTMPASSANSKSSLDSKYQPSITVKPGKPFSQNSDKKSEVVYPHPLIKATPAPTQQLYAISRMTALRQASSGSSSCSMSSSQSSLPSLSDCGQGGYLDMSAGLGHRSDAWSSSSSAALSDLDLDSSLTYVSMSSPNSTPTNSSLNLCQGDLPTPTNSPKLEHDTYRISSVSQADDGKKQGPVMPQQAVSQPIASGRGRRQALGSFAADASTEAAPVSWVGERLNSMTLSADSGFSSPTTPTTAGQNHHHLHLHQQGAPQSGPRHAQHIFVHQAQGHGEEILQSGDTHNKKVRTSTPPSQLSLGQKHEPLSTSLSAETCRTNHPSKPKAVSAHAVTKDRFPQQGWLNGVGSSGRPKALSQSSADVNKHTLSSPSHRQMSHSVSCPVGVISSEAADGVHRADSYRHAVRNTQGLVGDLATRNTSYRKATGDDDDDAMPDARMDAANAWSGNRSQVAGRDMRRMGITDVDQLKCYDSDSSTGRASRSSNGGTSSSRGFAGINSSRKKMKPEVQNLLRAEKTPSPEVKRMSKVSGKGGKDREKGKNPSSSSSTYVRFDPIFEKGDDMYSSLDTLRADSVEMISSEEGFLMGDKIVGKLPPGRVRGRKNVDEKAVTSILDSIRTTIKAMSGKSTADKDMWKYEGGP